MTALRMTGEMSSKPTRMREWLFVRTPSVRPCTSVSTEFRASWYSLRFSRSGRSEATAIIIPKAVETSASSASGTRMASSRSFLTRGGVGGEPSSSPSAGNSGVMFDGLSTLMGGGRAGRTGGGSGSTTTCGGRAVIGA